MNCDCIEKVNDALGKTLALVQGDNSHDPNIKRAVAEAFQHFAQALSTPPAEAARGEPGEANPNFSPSTVRALRHGMNCSGRAGDESGCTCGLLWRDQLETERTMHAAWRKRAEEAEAALAAASPPGQPAAQPATEEFDAEKWADRVRYRIDNSPSVNRVEIIASEGGLLWLSAYAAGLSAREQPKRWPDDKPPFGTRECLVRRTPDSGWMMWHDIAERAAPWTTFEWFIPPQAREPQPPAPKEVR